MNKLGLVVVVILVIGSWKYYQHQKHSYFDEQPVKSNELNFDHPVSEKVYAECVEQANQQIRRHFDSGRIDRAHYPAFLKSLKSGCRCYAKDPALVSAEQKREEEKISVQSYHRISQSALKKCMKQMPIPKR